MQRIRLFLACILLWACTGAQQYPFVHYTPREGLANNRARFVFQDSRGKLYISTFGGLSVYDGTRFTNYNTNNGLAASLVNGIVEMSEDSIWIVQNANKIHCLVNGRLKEFVPDDNFTPIINQLFKCSDGYYYALADEGLFRLEDRRFRKIPLDWLQRNGMAAGLISGVELNQKLFILSNPGFMSPYGVNLFVYDLLQQRIIAYEKNINATSITNFSGNEIWIPTIKGLYRIRDEGIGDGHIIMKPLSDAYPILKKLIPRLVYRDRPGNIWLSSEEGLYLIRNNGETSRFTVENGLPANYQNSIYQDDENNMWFTNEETGLCKLPNQELVFYPEILPGFHPTDFHISPSSDSVWIYDAVHRRILLMLPGRKPEEFSYTGPSPGPGSFLAGHKPYMLKGNTILRWQPDPVLKNVTLSLFHRKIDSDKGGEYQFGLVAGNGNLVTVSDRLEVLSDMNELTAPLDYFTDQVTVDDNGKIWVATRGNKLLCYEITESAKGKRRLSLLRTYQDELPLMSPRCITTDKSGNIWIGTRDHGLARLHFDGPDLVSIKLLTTKDGLSDNYVNYIFRDKDDHIWACTPSGLDRVRNGDNNYFIENITRRNNLYLPILKIQQSAEGKFWILSRMGLLTYEPLPPSPGKWKPRLHFTDIAIGNAPGLVLKPGTVLRHFQNNLNFQLSAPTFVDEKQTRFSYLLEGSNNTEWSAPSSNASINFVNLPPGDYRLRVKAIFLHGLYPEVASSIPFTVLPPWWQTWWFKISAALLILALVVAGLRYYIKRKLELQRMALEKEQAVEKERTRIATDIHDDLGAGLSRIKFLSETIGMKKQQHLPIEEEIDSIRTYSHDMIDKMGEIVWALNEKNDTLSDLLSYTRAYAAEYLEQNGITCRVDEPDPIPQKEVSGEFRRNMFLAVKEALHNIVKHAQATDVSIKIEINNQLHIQIRDNGIGMDSAGARKHGNGLPNMRARIEGLKGKFEISANGGTSVDIRVPLHV